MLSGLHSFFYFHGMITKESIIERLERRIVDVPDFPRKGIIFKDITPVLADPELIRDTVDYLADHYLLKDIDAVAGIESRGFFFGIQLARTLGLPFIPIRKEGKLPREKVKVSYKLEYGEAAVEAHADAIQPDWRVLIHDDLLATGGTAAAAAELIRSLKGEVAGFSFLIELGFLKGRDLLSKYSPEMHHLINYK